MGKKYAQPEHNTRATSLRSVRVGTITMYTILCIDIIYYYVTFPIRDRFRLDGNDDVCNNCCCRHIIICIPTCICILNTRRHRLDVPKRVMCVGASVVDRSRLLFGCRGVVRNRF